LVTVKEQRWEFKDGQKVKVKTEKGDNGVKVKRSELVQWLKQSDTWKEWESARFW
jgi:histidyl-tRNA synthetase